jgi:hypothetical protein
MIRRIIYKSELTSSRQTGLNSKYGAESTTASETADTYVQRLVKLIPAEIVSATVFIFRLLDGKVKDSPQYFMYEWISFGLLLAMIPFLYYGVISEKNRPTPWIQILFSAISYVVWVYYLGGPFVSLSSYNQDFGLALLVIVSVGVAAKS